LLHKSPAAFGIGGASVFRLLHWRNSAYQLTGLYQYSGRMVTVW